MVIILKKGSIKRMVVCLSYIKKVNGLNCVAYYMNVNACVCHFLFSKCCVKKVLFSAFYFRF